MAVMESEATRERSEDAATKQFDVVVIGGGQAGLAVGYYLKRKSLQFVILDEHDRVGDSWRSRWDSLRLFTPARYSGLPAMPFPGPGHAYPSKDQVADYLQNYASTMQLPVRSGLRASRVSRMGEDRWLVETSGPTFVAHAVVIATGGYQHPNIPEWSVDLDPGIHQLHSSNYRNPSQLIPGPVLVIGASHSGADIAIEVVRERPTVLAGRDTGQLPFETGGRLDRIVTPIIWFMANHVLTVDTLVGRKAKGQMLAHGGPLERPRRGGIAAAGVERVTVKASGVRDGKPMLEDGRVLETSNVIWCTGFRGDYSWIEGLTYGSDGFPDQDHGVVTGSPGLYFLGLRYQRAFASSLIGGVGRDAAYIARDVGQRAQVTG